MLPQAKTHWKRLHNPDYLGAYALDEGKDLIATIDFVKNEMVTGPDGKKEEKMVAHFQEKSVKPMIINATNAKIIQKLFGSPYIEDWAGQAIQIYSTEVKAFGDVVDALRVRTRLPQTKKDDLTPRHPKWDRAKASVLDKSTTIDSIRKKYILTDENAKLLLDGGEPDAT